MPRSAKLSEVLFLHLLILNLLSSKTLGPNVTLEEKIYSKYFLVDLGSLFPKL